jgi:hypothetical protein
MTNNGGPAFMYTNSTTQEQSGITIRDYFATKAIAGIITESIDEKINMKHLAKMAYKLADAMMEERTIKWPE